MYPTWMMRDGLSDTRLSKMLRSLDIDRETSSSPSVHVPPTCWLSIPGPSDHDVTSLLAPTSPISIVLERSSPTADINLPTEPDCRVGRGSHQHLTVRTPPAGRLVTDASQNHTPHLEVPVLTIEPVWLSLVISAVNSPDAPLWMKILASEPTPASRSPEGENLTSCTNFVCVLMV